MNKLVGTILCLVMLAVGSVVQAAPGDERGKIATSLKQGGGGGDVPTDNGTWSWHSDVMEGLCGSDAEPLTGYWTGHSEIRAAVCAYWTGHAERQQH